MTSNKLWSRLVLASTLAGGLALAFSGTARADRDWKEDCHRRLEADRARIDRDVNRHGEHSRQVDADVDRFDIGIYFGHHDDHHEEHHDDR